MKQRMKKIGSIGNYTEKKAGKPRTYDHDKIKKLIESGKKNPEIAEIIGCSSQYVWQLKARWGLVQKKGGALYE